MEHEKKVKKGADPEGNVIREDQFLEEYRKRYRIMSPGGAPWAARLTGLGFLWFLGASPAAALVNLTQTPLVALPQLAGEHGFRKSSAALTKAMGETLAARRKWGARSDYGAWRSLSEEDRAMLQWAHETGAIDATNVHSLQDMYQDKARMKTSK
ncbi:PLxRFG domain-containing protein [Halochromatium sp.]